MADTTAPRRRDERATTALAEHVATQHEGWIAEWMPEMVWQFWRVRAGHFPRGLHDYHRLVRKVHFLAAIEDPDLSCAPFRPWRDDPDFRRNIAFRIRAAGIRAGIWSAGLGPADFQALAESQRPNVERLQAERRRSLDAES